VLPPAVEAAADASARPAAVRAALERLLEARPGLGEELVATPGLLGTLTAVLGASPALGRLLQSDPQALDVLRHAGDEPGTAGIGQVSESPAGDAAELVAWSKREQLRIAARDLTGLDDLEAVGRNLSQLADTVLARSRQLAGSPAEGLLVVAMGKAGAQELNYASDVDIVLAGEGDPRQMLDIARTAFRVDLDLRPEGRAGPLVRSLDAYLAYWRRWAQAWERQALLKARTVAGPPELAAAFGDAAAAFVWDEPFSADDLRELRAMKARAESDIARRQLGGREIKRGPGGIRDVEFSVQLLQLIHGHHDPALRVRATVPALRELAGAGYVDVADAAALEAAYRFLRTVEHRLQQEEWRQTHTVPAERAGLQWLARVTGLRDDPSSSAADKFDAELRRQRHTARAVHERLFFRPLLEAFSASSTLPFGPALSPAAAGERLAAFGFADGERARAALLELTRGLTRSSRMMQALLPLMLGWLADSPDPDLGLTGLRQLAGVPASRRDAMIGVFRDSTEVARRACTLLGTSPLLHEPLRRDPSLLVRLGSEGGLVERGRADLLAQAEETVAWRDEPEHRQSGLRRLATGETAVVMAADVLAVAGVDQVGRWLADLAEATLETALQAIGPEVPLAVIGMGRLGGAELHYASDLDVLLVLGGDPEGGEAAASRLLRFVNGDTPARRIFTLDLRLRPEGRKGALARSVEGYTEYYRRWAGVWERQALLRARPVAGDAALAARFMGLAAEVTLGTPFGPEQAREIRRMKARIETERLPAGEDPQFHLKLGPGAISDVEWTVQLLQLRHGVAGSGTLEAMEDLVAAGALDRADADVLAASYRHCELLRNRLYLVQGSPGDALPSAPERLAVLARSLGTHPSALRDRYRQVTRRARRVTERLFYDRQSLAGSTPGP
jgi:glutamate-ammonia-ligase adenylyltransferase